MVVTATTLLLKSYARVHDWASKGTSLGGRARLSSWLFSLLRCKMSLILPKRLYGVTPGKTMQAEDPLSRQADHEMGIDLDNTNQVLLKPEFFTINALCKGIAYSSLDNLVWISII